MLNTISKNKSLPPKSSITRKVPKVMVLLCGTANTEYADEQLVSIQQQKKVDVKISVSVDSDKLETVSTWKSKLRAQFEENNYSVFSGPMKGFAANFMSTIFRADENADYFAFSDQDDIWEDNKLSTATATLSRLPKEIPAIFCSRTRIVDRFNKEITLSPLFSKNPSFKNAIVQSIAGGNTMVFNSKALKLLKTAGIMDVVSHDWWAYMLITGAGGEVIYDQHPHVRYRQHGSNLIGSNNNWLARLKRVSMLMEGNYKNWGDKNVEALTSSRKFLTADNQLILDKFSISRKSRLIPRCIGIFRSGVYRQTFLGNIGLIAATLLNKI